MSRKRTSKQIAKDRAWKAFSIFIRTRDCLRFTGDPEQGICVTCGKQREFKKLQAGHFIGGRTSAVLFDEKITYTQDYSCNVGRGGNYLEYYYFMVKEMGGHEAVENYRNEVKQRKVKYSEQDYKDIESLYKEKTKDLALQKTPAEDLSIFDV